MQNVTENDKKVSQGEQDPYSYYDYEAVERRKELKSTLKFIFFMAIIAIIIGVAIFCSCFK